MKCEGNCGNPMIASKVSPKAFIVSGEASEAIHPAECSFYYPPARQQNKPSLCLFQLHNAKIDSVPGSLLGGLVTGVSLIHKGNFHILTCGFLNLSAKLSGLVPFLLVGRSHQHSKQVSKNIDSDVGFGALLAFVAVVSRTASTFWDRLNRPPIENRSGGFVMTSVQQS